MQVDTYASTEALTRAFGWHGYEMWEQHDVQARGRAGRVPARH